MSEESRKYTVNLLQLGVRMPSGRVYVDNEITRDALRRFSERVEKGLAKVEYGMPKLDGIAQENIQIRMASVSERRVCAKIEQFSVVDGVVSGTFVPHGEMSPTMLGLLDGDAKGEIPVFGMRAFSRPIDDTPGANEHEIYGISTFDFIGTEPPHQPDELPDPAKVKQAVPDSINYSGTEVKPVPLDSIGRQMEEAVKLPDGSGVFTGKFPLPKDHWIYQSSGDGSGEPPAFMRMGTQSPFRPVFEKAAREAAKYAVRATTRCGQDQDFDPDALVTNLLIGLFGYFTPDGTSGDALDGEPARLFAPRITLPKDQAQDIALSCGFTLKPQGEGKPDALHPYVFEYANAVAMAAMQQFIGELATAQYLADVQPPKNSNLETKDD